MQHGPQSRKHCPVLELSFPEQSARLCLRPGHTGETDRLQTRQGRRLLLVSSPGPLHTQESFSQVPVFLGGEGPERLCVSTTLLSAPNHSTHWQQDEGRGQAPDTAPFRGELGPFPAPLGVAASSQG